ncbi:MAG: hypothetical protein K2W96_22520, partial [Gemmataceae bacterium]|nr:hypothetical protein [Gemmataceae bacterium]
AVFRRWGIVGAPRLFSRDFMCRAVADFVAEGPLAVAPHTIPHRTMHSPSGTLSLALGLQGPNHGAGGGPGCEAEGLLCALALLREQRLPGVWLLLSRIEPLIDGDPLRGQIPPGTFAEAVALALVPSDSPLPGETLSLAPDPAAEEPAFTLESVRALLAEGGERVLPGFGRLALSRAAPLLRWAA